MNRTAIYILAASLAVPFALPAQEPDFDGGSFDLHANGDSARGMRRGSGSSGENNDGANSGRRRDRRSMRRQDQRSSAEISAAWAKAQSELKKKSPEKYKEIETLASTNLVAAMEKLRELAKASGVELPSAQMRGGMPAGNGNSPEGFMRGGGMAMRGGMTGFQNSRASVEAELKKKYPEDFAKIEQSRAALEEQLQALAKKAGVKLPETMETMRAKIESVRNSEKYKARFAEIDELSKTDRRAAMEATLEIFRQEGIEMPFHGTGMMNRTALSAASAENASGQDSASEPSRGADIRKIKAAREKYPEEAAKIEALRRTDPKAYASGMMKLVARLDAEQKKEASAQQPAAEEK